MSTSRPCDPQPFLEAIDDDREAYAEMVDLFRETGRAQIERVIAASHAADVAELHESLHALSGSLSIVNADASLQMMRCMRTAMARRDRGELVALAERLMPEFERVCQELDRWCPAHDGGQGR